MLGALMAIRDTPAPAALKYLSAGAPQTLEHSHRGTHTDMKWATTLALAAALMCLDSVQSVCPTGFVNFADDGEAEICLSFVRSKATWSGMRALCQAVNSDLAKLTGDLHQKVVEYINDQPEGDLDDEAFWLGGTDEVVEGVWRWVADNSIIPLGTPHWYPCTGQPNGGTTQNHLSLYTPDFYFHSLEASRQIFGICRI